MRTIIILKDHSDYTATSLKSGINRSINQQRLKMLLENKGYSVKTLPLHNLDLEELRPGMFVFYPSSEDKGLFYKEYIGDILMDLSLRGLILLPEYKYFRAHHNKVFMELLRNELKHDELKTIRAESIYDIRDLKESLQQIECRIGYPMVLKTSSGSGAAGVDLANNRNELISKAKKMGAVSYTRDTDCILKNVLLSKLKTRALKTAGKPYIIRTYPREKMILQSFVPNLQYDYKVLVYGEKYYVLKRLIRDNDFRASGSGKLIFPEKMDSEICKVLDMARMLFIELDVPMLSVDVAYDRKKCHLIEFQCLSFGPYTMQYSDSYYRINAEGHWEKLLAQPDLENEICNSLDLYIRGHYNE